MRSEHIKGILVTMNLKIYDTLAVSLKRRFFFYCLTRSLLGSLTGAHVSSDFWMCLLMIFLTSVLYIFKVTSVSYCHFIYEGFI